MAKDIATDASTQKHHLSSSTQEIIQRQRQTYLNTKLLKLDDDKIRQTGLLAGSINATTAAKTEATQGVAKLESKKDAREEMISKQNAELKTLEQGIKTRFHQDICRDSGIEIDSGRPSVLDGPDIALNDVAFGPLTR
ncbi:hypothetical protein ACHAO9_012144 [Fusarium lateritium]